MATLDDYAQHLEHAVENKWDGIVMVDGLEGSGKSSLALSWAYKLDRSMCLERVIFTPKQFHEAVEKAKPGQAIVWDEFISGGMSDAAITRVQREVKMKMTMIRKKRLYIILVMPYYFMATRYFAVARTRFLIHMYTPDGIKRGFWRAWKYEAKKEMYRKGKKDWEYCVPPNDRGTVDDFFSLRVIDKGAYERKKDEATREEEVETKSVREQKQIKALRNLINVVVGNGWLTRKDIIRITGYTKQTIRERYMKPLPDEDEGDLELEDW